MTPPYQELRASDDVTVRREKIQRRSVKDLCQLGGPRVKSAAIRNCAPMVIP
jgi:hypothetical protein